MAYTASYFGMDADAWKKLNIHQQAAVGAAATLLTESGMESTGFRVTGPVWQQGDVVVARYASDPKAYTYLRGPREWSNGGHVDATDDAISDLWRRGEATHVLRDGRPLDNDGHKGQVAA